MQKRFVPLTVAALQFVGSIATGTAPVSAAGLHQSLIEQTSVNSVSPKADPLPSQVTIVLDDFTPQPLQGDSIYYYNRLEGDRGVLNDSVVEWGNGQVTTTIAVGRQWCGVWMSLNHPYREKQAINFSGILPEQVLPAYQSKIQGVTVEVVRGTPGRILKLELKEGDAVRWSNTASLTGGQQTLAFGLPPLSKLNQFVWVLDQAVAGDYVVIDRISFTATNPIADSPMAAFVWSYGMLLNNWNPTTGLARDKAKDASGEFDAIQATGSLAAATALAYQLGVISQTSALTIVNRISDTLLLDLPRLHGLWPHWVKITPSSTFTIVENTEWSSVDTAIAAIGLLDAQNALMLDTSGTEKMLREIDWNALRTSTGIAHGYTYTGTLIPAAWDTFGGESWLVDLAYAASTKAIPPLEYPTPPTANGSGFIDELAWIFLVPPRPPTKDSWGVDWHSYRRSAADAQWSYYPTKYPGSCFARLGLFGLSAAEVPMPSQVSKDQIYQAFGVGGRFSPPNDGSSLLGYPVVTPHYSAMVASLRPTEAINMWTWLINQGHFSPLNNVESLMFTGSDCTTEQLKWNQLKGSWNLALQTLGWGNYLVERKWVFSLLGRSLLIGSFLSTGYRLLMPISIALPIVHYTVYPIYSREAEIPDEYTVGEMIFRSNASSQRVHGQFGSQSSSPWSARAGYVKYVFALPQIQRLFFKLRYSKYSSSVVPIQVFLDNESASRASFYPVDQGDWNRFTESGYIDLGIVSAGVHTIKLFTVGQQHGVADLDSFLLAA